jgi:hypothetical protein
MIYTIKCFGKITRYFMNMHFIIKSTYDFICKSEYKFIHSDIPKSRLFICKGVP